MSDEKPEREEGGITVRRTYSRTPPENPREGDYWVIDKGLTEVTRRWLDGRWTLVEGGSPAPPEPTPDPLDDGTFFREWAVGVLPAGYVIARHIVAEPIQHPEPRLTLVTVLAPYMLPGESYVVTLLRLLAERERALFAELVAPSPPTAVSLLLDQLECAAEMLESGGDVARQQSARIIRHQVATMRRVIAARTGGAHQEPAPKRQVQHSHGRLTKCHALCPRAGLSDPPEPEVESGQTRPEPDAVGEDHFLEDAE